VWGFVFLAFLPSSMPDAPQRIPLAVGTIVDNFRITAVVSVDDDSCIGYKAEDPRLKRTTSLLEIFPRSVLARAADGITLEPTSSDNAERFRIGLESLYRDVRRVATLRHPNVVDIYGYVLLNGTAYIYGEYLDGLTIADAVREGGGRISEFDASLLAADVLDGLSAAHGTGLVHSNVTPDNTRLTRDNHVKLTNFFNARRDWSDVDDVRNTIAASPFAAPELITGDERGAFTDVYSVAATLYWCVTGAAPPRAIQRLLKSAELVPPRDLVSNIRLPFQRVLLRALSMQPSERYATAQDFLNALADVDRQSSPVRIMSSDTDAAPPTEIAFDAEPPRAIVAHADSVAAIEPASGDPIASRETEAHIVDENVQFTVYRPSVVRPAEWNTLLAFAHLSEAREGSNDPDPVEQVERQAIQILESRIDAYGKVVQDSVQAVPREGTLTFAPHIDGVEFNPAQRSFAWVEDVHREEFRFRASATLNGKVARGRMTVYHGAIILAEVSLSMRVDAGYHASPSEPPSEPAHARPFRRIFASYSHKDLEIVRQFERFATTLGDRYLRDWNELRAGEAWNDRLMELIGEADVFQLFWSRNAMTSPHVRREWEFALSLGRPNFVRPTYWEDPLPETSDGGLPPTSLKQLHFQRISLASGDGPDRELSNAPLPPVPYESAPPRRMEFPSEPTPLFPSAPGGQSRDRVDFGARSSEDQFAASAPVPAPAMRYSRPAMSESSLTASSAPVAPGARFPLRLVLTILLVLMLVSAIIFALR
jgi:serine/threonine protein kinase